MDILVITSTAVVVADPPQSRRLFIDTLGLALEGEDDGYYSSGSIPGSKHFGIWPLSQAAEACFGTPTWPADRVVPLVPETARTVLAASPNCRATCRTEAISQASPTASSNRLENGALPGNRGTFSRFTPQSGQWTRYTSTNTVAVNPLQGRSRTARSPVS